MADLVSLVRESPRYESVRPQVDVELMLLMEDKALSAYLLHLRDKGIKVSNACQSTVAYCLGITDERPTRPVASSTSGKISFPDIDMDFPDDRRADMIEYVTKTYGADRVAQIITFGTMAAKAAVRDAGRALGMTLGDVDRVARLIPSTLHVTLEDALRESAELGQLVANEPLVARLIEMARGLEGTVRNASIHAAGVVISASPLVETVPLQRAAQGELVTQYPAADLESLGMLKMDFLGLSNMTIVGNALKLIERTRGIKLDLKAIPYDDARTYDMLGEGETTAVFQLESAGMRRYIKELKPRNLKEIAALIALYRPGPMSSIPRYIRVKNGEAAVEYLHPELEPFLRETFGVIVYQDQAMLIAVHLAGYSWSEADALRKAMAKKKPEIIAEHRGIFIERAVARGVERSVAEAIFAQIEPFAGYGFPKAHAARYANDCYQNAFLKANYSAEYMAAVLTAEMGDSAKVSAAVVEARRLGVDVLPPSINASSAQFAVERSAIRFGLAAIKGVGSAPVEAIVHERERQGPFASLEDLCGRVDLRLVNRKTLECLIKAGALDELGDRSQLLDDLEKAVATGQHMQRASLAGQTSLFGGPTTPTARPGKQAAPPPSPAAQKERLHWEKELLGLYLSEHPLMRVAASIAAQATHAVSRVGEDAIGQKVTVGGMVASTRQIMTKSGQTMLYAELEDVTGSLEVVVFPRTYESTRDVWADDAILFVTGKAEMRGDRIQVICEQARPVNAFEPPKRHYLRITIPRFADVATCRRRLELLRDALLRYPGDDNFDLRVQNHVGIIKIADVPGATTGYCPELDAAIRKLLGPDSLTVQELRPRSLEEVAAS